MYSQSIFSWYVLQYICNVSKGLKFPGLSFSNEPGKMFSLNMQDSRMKPVELRMPRNFDLESFNPHGIYAYTDPSGKSTYGSFMAAHMLHLYLY